MMHRALKRFAWVFTFAILLGLLAIRPASAQDAGQLGRLFITGADTEMFPSVELQVYGMDGQGNPLDLPSQRFFLTHGGEAADIVTYEGTRPVGTLTVFLIDAPSGIQAELGAIESAIRQYAGPATMLEQTDAVAVYQIGPDGPRQLLPPSRFHNEVANLVDTSDIVPEDGLTALIDSTLAMLDQIEGLKPDPAMAASLVLISDGTDAVSTAEPGEVLVRASNLGIPVHTIRVNNPDLIQAGQELGRQYLADVAGGSRGLAAELTNPDELAAIWNRIASFRNQGLLRYTVTNPEPGSIPVELSIVDNPDLRASTEVEVPAAAPNVTLNIPFESRSLTLPTIEDPVTLRLSATVTWLDGEEREIVDAGLLSNSVRVFDIPPGQLDDFTVELQNLFVGENRLEVTVTDSQGMQAASGPVLISVAEGERVVPEALQPQGSPGWVTWLLIILGLLLLAGLLLVLWRRSRGRSSRRSRRRAAKSPADMGLEEYNSVGIPDAKLATSQPFVMAHLDVLESQTFMPEEINLGDDEVKFGRSPSQVDVAFRDDITVSRYHAVFRLEGTHYRLYDAGSTSGTFVNEQPVPEYGTQLRDGDIINLGAVRLRYRQL